MFSRSGQSNDTGAKAETWVWNVVAYGTGQKSLQEYHTISRLSEALEKPPYTIEGPGLVGTEVSDDVVGLVKAIRRKEIALRKKRPHAKLAINAKGFSRGAVTLLMVANLYYERYPDSTVKFNLLLADPVTGYFKRDDLNRQLIPPNVETCIVTGQQHEGRWLYQSQVSRLCTMDPRTSLVVLPMPGIHDSATILRDKGTTYHAAVIMIMISYLFYKEKGSKFSDIPNLFFKDKDEKVAMDERLGQRRGALHTVSLKIKKLQIDPIANKREIKRLKEEQDEILKNILLDELSSMKLNESEYVDIGKRKGYVSKHEEKHREGLNAIHIYLFKYFYPLVFNHLFEGGVRDPSSSVSSDSKVKLAELEEEFNTLKLTNTKLFDLLIRKGILEDKSKKRQSSVSDPIEASVLPQQKINRNNYVLPSKPKETSRIVPLSLFPDFVLDGLRNFVKVELARLRLQRSYLERFSIFIGLSQSIEDIISKTIDNIVEGPDSDIEKIKMINDELDQVSANYRAIDFSSRLAVGLTAIANRFAVKKMELEQAAPIKMTALESAEIESKLTHKRRVIQQTGEAKLSVDVATSQEHVKIPSEREAVSGSIVTHAENRAKEINVENLDDSAEYNQGAGHTVGILSAMSPRRKSNSLISDFDNLIAKSFFAMNKFSQLEEFSQALAEDDDEKSESRVNGLLGQENIIRGMLSDILRFINLDEIPSGVIRDFNGIIKDQGFREAVRDLYGRDSKLCLEHHRQFEQLKGKFANQNIISELSVLFAKPMVSDVRDAGLTTKQSPAIVEKGNSTVYKH